MEKIINIKNDQSTIISAFIFTIMLNIYIFSANAVGRVFIGESPIDTLLVYVIYAIVSCKAIIILIKKIDVRVMFSILLISLFIIVSIVLNNNKNYGYNSFSDVIYLSFFSIFVGLLFSTQIYDFDLFLSKLYKNSKITGILMIISFYLYTYRLNVKWDSNAMGLSYMMLIPAIICFSAIIKKFDITHFAIFVILSFLILFNGSRGPFLSLMIFIVLRIIMISTKHQHWKKYILIFFGLMAIFLVLLYYENILNYLSNLAQKFGYRAKIIEWALNDRLADSNGRDTISRYVINMITENGMFGGGFLADRININTYAHNLALEILLDFGIVFGIIIIGSILIGLVKTLIRADNQLREVILILICAFIIKLFLSGSFWTEPVFFYLFGVFMFLKTKSKEGKMLLK